MREDSIILFLEGDFNRAALQYQRMSKEDRERTFWARTSIEAIEILKSYQKRLDMVSLGYRLENSEYSHPANENCGLEVVRWLERQDSKDYSHVQFIIHDWDKAGQKMTNRLLIKGYNASHIPFGLKK